MIQANMELLEKHEKEIAEFMKESHTDAEKREFFAAQAKEFQKLGAQLNLVPEVNFTEAVCEIETE